MARSTVNTPGRRVRSSSAKMSAASGTVPANRAGVDSVTVRCGTAAAARAGRMTSPRTFSAEMVTVRPAATSSTGGAA